MFKLISPRLLVKQLNSRQTNVAKAISTSRVHFAEVKQENDVNNQTTHFGFETVKENEKADKGELREKRSRNFTAILHIFDISFNCFNYLHLYP